MIFGILRVSIGIGGFNGAKLLPYHIFDTPKRS
jgi:hypothetical protein